MERTLPAKARHVEVLQVANWLHRPQRFEVAIERLAADAATKLEGPPHLEVPGGAARQYSLAWYSYTQVGCRHLLIGDLPAQLHVCAPACACLCLCLCLMCARV